MPHTPVCSPGVPHVEHRDVVVAEATRWRSEFDAKWSFSRGEYKPPLNGDFRPVPVIRGIEPLLALRFRAQTYLALFPIACCAMWFAALEFTGCIIFMEHPGLSGS